MAPPAKLLAATFLPLLASAHFQLNAPPTIGFDEDNEGKGPCGGFTPDFTKDNVTDFHVGGEPIALFLGHPQADWLFRGTLDTSASGNWTQLFPIVRQSGLGDFCEPGISAPSAWVGQQGVVGIVAQAVDGLLYQVCYFPSSCRHAGWGTRQCWNHHWDAPGAAVVALERKRTDDRSCSSLCNSQQILAHLCDILAQLH